ncbi:MAG: nuclear transport factor 2 family protein [Planctomycetota bacterium]
MTPAEAAQAQLDAYNARDIDAFLIPYHTDVELFRLPGEERFARGRDEMRAIYSELFAGAPELHCRLITRIAHDRFVIDHEDVTGMPGRERLGAVAIYEVVNGLIRRAWFLK